MGGICSRNSTTDNPLGGSGPHAGDHVDHGSMGYQSKTIGELTPPYVGEIMDKGSQEPVSFSERTTADSGNRNSIDVEPGELQLDGALSLKSNSTRLKPATGAKMGTTKVEVSSLLGRAGTVGLGKAVEVLDTLGSSMTSLNLNNGFGSGATTKGSKIAILAFEVANTIVKGSNLLQSLSKESIEHLKGTVLPSEGVHFLVSKDMDELLWIAAADKREELKVFSREVVRFGDRCKDPQWHHLDRYFDRLGSELVPQRQSREVAEAVMQWLMTLVQFTAELYHELHALDRLEQDHRRKLQEEENSNTVQKGESLAILRAELKSQRKHVKSLEKKSLWSKNLEEVVEKLVDIVHFLHVEIHDALGNADGDKQIKGSLNNRQRLGSAGLALHYANIISQIDTLVSRSGSVPPNSRDTLYQGLPSSIKSALRSKLQSFQVNEQLAIPQIKAEMEKILQWLVPIAANTTKAHHGFGWVGEWANTGSEANKRQAGQNDLIRIETLYHAEKEKVEAYILELVIWLHHLISQSRSGANGDVKSPIKSPVRSPNQRTSAVLLKAQKPSSPTSVLTLEDHEMLRVVNFRKLTPGISKSQEFDTTKTRVTKQNRLSKSSSHSPTSGSKELDGTEQPPSTIPDDVHFDIDRIKALDVIDRVDTIRSL